MNASLSKPARPGALLGFTGLAALAAMSGGRSTQQGLGPWYQSLRKPPFQPPSWAFAPVWTVLYGLIALSGWRVFRRRPGARRRRALQLWAAQLGLNAAWSWLFFAKRRPALALADSALLFATIQAYRKAAREVDPVAARLLVPYAGWVAFATLLNEEIVRRSRGQGALAVTSVLK